MIRCWLTKRSLARHFEGGQSVAPKVKEHLLACASCRSLYETHSRIVQRLRQESPSRLREAPPFLRGKIMARLDGEGVAPVSRPPVRVSLWSTVAASLLLALGLVVALTHRPAGSLEKGIATPIPPVVSPAAEAIGEIRLPDREAIQAWSKQWDQPLEKELQAILSDAQNAVHLLAQNFLPENNAP